MEEHPQESFRQNGFFSVSEKRVNRYLWHFGNKECVKESVHITLLEVNAYLRSLKVVFRLTSGERTDISSILQGFLLKFPTD